MMRHTRAAASTAIVCAVIMTACTPTSVEEDPTTSAELTSSPGEEPTTELPSGPVPGATDGDERDRTTEPPSGPLPGATDGDERDRTTEPPSGPAPGATDDDMRDPSSLPTCETLFTQAGLALVDASGLDPLGDVSAPGRGGYGTSDPDLQTLIDANESVSCTFVLPGSERGMSTSVAVIDDKDRETVVMTLEATGFTPEYGGVYHRQEEGDLPFTEAHLLDDGVWVSSYDGFGISAVDYVRDAHAALKLADDA